MTKKINEFFSRMGYLAIIVGMFGGLIGYFFIPLPIEYGSYIVMELIVFGLLCFVASEINYVENVVKRLLFGKDTT